MSSLIFRVLDHHVVHGLADELAIQDDRGMMSYAELLHESASVAGAFTNVGIAQGAAVQIDLAHGRELVVAVLACTRIGAVPRATAEFRVAGSPPVLHTSETEVPWDLLIKAGRIDPAPAPSEDPEGYEALMREAYAEVFSALEAGETIT